MLACQKSNGMNYIIPLYEITFSNKVYVESRKNDSRIFFSKFKTDNTIGEISENIEYFKQYVLMLLRRASALGFGQNEIKRGKITKFVYRMEGRSYMFEYKKDLN